MMIAFLRKTLTVTSAKIYGDLKKITHSPSIVNCPAVGLTFRKGCNGMLLSVWTNHLNGGNVENRVWNEISTESKKQSELLWGENKM